LTTGLRIESLYKIFHKSPAPALELLKKGASKEQVLAETQCVVGLNDVSLTVEPGAISMIMGLSGSGKSTLARCVNRLHEPTAGRILLDGEDILTFSEAELRELRRTRISMVFQHFALLPNKSVIENTEFGLKMRGVRPAERRRRAEEVLSIVGLANWAQHYPGELSGGMRQRVGLARALATDADILIMDEAFSALDPLIRTEMQDELLRLQRTLKKTILFITHDFQEALKLGNRIAIMADGKIMREGTPQSIVLDPGSDYVAAFTRDVDKSRLFDAWSTMSRPRTVASVSGGGSVVVGDVPDEIGIVLDQTGRPLGSINAADIERLQKGIDAKQLTYGDVATVPGNATLLEVARKCRHGMALCVVDDVGRLVGTLLPTQILSRISERPVASETSNGGHHAQG